MALPISTLLPQRLNELKHSPHTSSTNSADLAKTINTTSPSTKLLAKIPTPENFLTTFNPSKQVQITANIQKATHGNYPSLRLVAITYGKNTAEAWIEIQLNELSEFTGCKTKLDNTQTEQTAQMILNSYPNLTIAHLMIFFQRFKRCDYGKFYGAVDPIIIMGALADFQKELNYHLHLRQQEKEKQIKLQQNISLMAEKDQYRRRVPGAFTPHAIIDWTVYSLLHLRDLSDSQLACLLKNIQSGKTQLPSFIQIIRSPQTINPIHLLNTSNQ